MFSQMAISETARCRSRIGNTIVFNIIDQNGVEHFTLLCTLDYLAEPVYRKPSRVVRVHYN